jgi:hypothetical protein
MKRICALLLFTLAGCSIFVQLVPGSSREADAIAKFGKPDEVRTLPDGGKVLEFPQGPEGWENWRVTLGPAGVVNAVEQLVDEPYFAKVHPGMTQREVLLVLGRPIELVELSNLDEVVLSWNYTEPGNRAMQFNAHLNRSGVVKEVSRTYNLSRDPDGE